MSLDSARRLNPRAIGRTSGILVAVLGGLVLAGWILDIAGLRSFGLSGVTMKVNTALSFALLGASLALAAPAGDGSPPKRRLAYVLAAIVLGISLPTLGEYVFGVDLGIDQILAREAPGSAGTVIPGRMAPNSALAFLLLGTGIFFVDRETARGTRPSECFAAVAGLGAWIALLGHLHGDPPFFGLEAYTQMALPTILLFLSASLGLFFARPDRGFASFLAKPRSGGRVLRNLLAVSFALPALLGWLFVRIERSGRYSSALVVLLLVVAATILLSVAAVWAIRTIRRRDDMFFTTFDQAAVGIAHVGLDGRYLRVNAKFCEITGYTRWEMLARRFQTITHPDDLAADDRNREEFFAGRRKEATLEKRYLRKDGAVAWVRLTSSLVRAPSGEPDYFIAVVEDISERRQAEAERARLVAAIEQSHEIVMITDTSGIIEYVNPAFERVTGYARSETVGRHTRILSSGRQSQEFYRDLWETLLRGERWFGTFVNRKKDGSEYEEESVISPVRDAEGSTTHFVAVKRDVTADRVAEKAVAIASRESARADRAEAQVQQAQKMESIGRLAGGVAHDFNNLLTVIQANVETLLEDLPAGGGDRSLVEEVRECADRATALTRQLLAFSRKQVLEPRVFALDGAVLNSVRMLRRLIGEDIAIRTNLPAGVGHVRADPGQIEQVILNLAVNARDAMPHGGRLSFETANVELDAEYVAEHSDAAPGPHVLLAVRDTGEGMNAETQARIFEPFFTTKERGRGTGLGLSTVYGIVRQSGGHLTVESEIGKGTTFKIHLPRVEAPAEIAEPAAEGPVRRGSETILLVEDEAAVRTAARRALQRQGYRVLEAADGETAILLFLKYREAIGLLLTDVVMPRASGPELAARFVRDRPGLKVLFVSGYTEDGIVHHGVLDPGVNFLQKPFTGDALARRVREILDA